MTPPAAFDGAEFRRLADAMAQDYDQKSMLVMALRYAATLADELEKWRERGDSLLRYSKDKKDSAMMAIVAEILLDAERRAALKDRT